MAELIEMPFGLWTWVSPRKHVLGWVHTGATWRIPLNIHVRRRCGLLSNYSDHLFFWPWKAFVQW